MRYRAPLRHTPSTRQGLNGDTHPHLQWRPRKYGTTLLRSHEGQTRDRPDLAEAIPSWIPAAIYKRPYQPCTHAPYPADRSCPPLSRRQTLPKTITHSLEKVAPAPLPTAESSTPKKTSRPRVRLSKNLRDKDDKTLAALLSRAIGSTEKQQRVRNYLQEVNRRFGV